jgi:acyl-coenzyme A thioesterase PaaI-like protein
MSEPEAGGPASEDWQATFEQAMNAELTPRRAEQRRVAAALRLVIERAVATAAPPEVLAQIARELEEVAGALEGYPQGTLYEGFAETANAPSPRAFFDHSPFMGAAHPIAPPMELSPEDGRIVGRVRFGTAYEGPPGCVHGGFIAAIFDELLGLAQSISGKPGMTARLTVSYRLPTPLHTDLRLEGELVRVEGRKIFTVGRCFHGEVLTAEAEGLFISIDIASYERLHAAREAVARRAAR